jgi:hypothetical protein
MVSVLWHQDQPVLKILSFGKNSFERTPIGLEQPASVCLSLPYLRTCRTGRLDWIWIRRALILDADP